MNNFDEELKRNLSRFIEEAGEVLFWIGKLQRFGPFSSHPKYNDEPNWHGLSRELDDLLMAIAHLDNQLNYYRGISQTNDQNASQVNV